MEGTRGNGNDYNDDDDDDDVTSVETTLTACLVQT